MSVMSCYDRRRPEKSEPGRLPMDQYLGELTALWEQATKHHPFLVAVKNGTITPQAFNRWLEQDYIFVRSFLPFVSILLQKTLPPNHYATLSTVDATLQDELAWFVEKGRERGLDLTKGKAMTTTSTYIAYMEEVSREADYASHLAVYWLIEAVYQSAWSWVLSEGHEGGEYREFALRWGSSEFRAFCDTLKGHANEATQGLEEGARAKLGQAFKRVLELEKSFWQMAIELD